MINLKNKEWKEFFIGGKNGLFSISGTITTHPSKLIKGGSVPRITCSSNKNGLDDLYSNEATEKGGILTVDSAAIGYVTYQEKDFIATDHVEKIFMKDKKINRNIGLGLVTCIRNSTLNKFNYGYKFSQERIKKQKILLPVNEKNEPDYEYMENYTKSIIDEKVEIYKKYIQNVLAGLEYKEIEPLENKEWKEFKFIDIFNIKSGFYNKKPELEKEGDIPFIGAVDNSNGITEFYTLKNIENSSKTGDKNNHSIDKKIFEKNAICVTNNGSVGYAYYQQSDFTCTHDVNPLYLKKYLLNKNLAMFLITCIEKQRVCFEYSRKWRPKRMIKSNILLPVNENNEPDYEYMEQYSKNLMYKKIKQYLNYKNKEA